MRVFLKVTGSKKNKPEYPPSLNRKKRRAYAKNYKKIIAGQKADDKEKILKNLKGA